MIIFVNIKGCSIQTKKGVMKVFNNKIAVSYSDMLMPGEEYVYYGFKSMII